DTPPDDDDGTPPDDPLPIVQLLTNGSYIQSNFGAVLGTVDNTLPEPRVSYIVAVSEPITPLHAALNPIGHYFNFGTVTKTVSAALDAPLVVGLPVPDGVNPEELAAAVLVPGDRGSLHTAEDQWVVQ